LASRSKVLLEVNASDGPKSAGERWLALVSWNPKSAHLRTVLNPALRRDYVVPRPGAGLESGTVGALFRRMTTVGQSVWFVPLFEWGGAAIFIRKPAKDAVLAEILTFNRQGRRPRTWRLPLSRFYPEALRKAYAAEWATGLKRTVVHDRSDRSEIACPAQPLHR
jgi:hypothetical protein